MVSVIPGVSQFIKKYGLSAQSTDFNSSCANFIAEMERGLAGRKSSLMMIPTYIGLADSIPSGKPVIVLDAGGTNLRVAVVVFESGEPKILYFEKYIMPGVKEEITYEDFFDTLAGYLLPVASQSDRISFCFSYACSPLADRDGIVLEMGKQVKIRDIVGKKIGAGLNDSLIKHGCGKKQICVMNDSASVLLAGKAAGHDQAFDSYMGFILGTGTNTSYVESNTNIQKASLRDQGGSMVINMESGGYALFAGGALDSAFDAGTNDPGVFPYEKMVSGRYQGGLALLTLQKAAGEGIFSDCCAEKLNRIATLSSREIDEFLDHPDSPGALHTCCASGHPGAQDRESLTDLLNALIDRSAKLAAINILSVIIKTGKGKKPGRPVCITADGSVFQNSKTFRQKLDKYLQTYSEAVGIGYEIHEIKDATLLGTAIAGLA